MKPLSNDLSALYFDDRALDFFRNPFNISDHVRCHQKVKYINIVGCRLLIGNLLMNKIVFMVLRY